MIATERLARECAFHDQQASQRAATFVAEPHRLQFADADYLDHESWVRPAFAKLGNVRGRDVLDYGCGHGMAAVVLARGGARVTACDLSGGYVTEARRRAAANDVHVDCTQADGERLPFAAGSFDAVWGHAILHHLDVPTASRELKRVLRPGGVWVLCEPWGENPFLRVARRWLPYAGKGHTADEEPLREPQVRQLADVFGRVEVEGFQLLSMLRRAWPGPASLLHRGDERLLGRWPSLKRYARYVVLTARA
ncbi:MAG: class I SAM-dependent methyltransferase [Gemmataceae bacterium]